VSIKPGQAQERLEGSLSLIFLRIAAPIPELRSLMNDLDAAAFENPQAGLAAQYVGEMLNTVFPFIEELIE
jgi:hypothetical protein